MISQNKLKELLHYNPDTGVFTWKKSVARCLKVGCKAGTSTSSTGYHNIGLNYKVIGAHRLAFLYMKGCIPDVIDHVNQIRNDNRWDNLREANRHINGRNQKLHKTNKSGACGVFFDKKRNKWKAAIKVSNKTIHLGYFLNINDAKNARKTANIKYNFSENHGVSI